MNSRRLIPVVLALVAAGAVLFFWPSEHIGPEEEVRRTVIAMTREAEEKDVSAVMDHIAESFHHNRGWGRDELKGFLAAQILRGSWMRIFVEDIETEVLSPTEVKLRGRFLFGRSEADTAETLAADTSLARYRVEATFVKEADGVWRAVKADHQSL